MKIKGKYEKINPLYALYVILGLLAVSVPVRMYQLLNIVERGTGFYKNIDWSVYLMYGLCAAAVAATYVLLFLSKNVPESKAPVGKNKFLAASSIIFAAGIVADVISVFSLFFTNSKIGTDTLGQEQIPLLIEAALGVCAAIYMLVFGISYIDGRTTYFQYKFLAITPVFWAMIRIVARFVRKISYVNVSDLMLELFAIAFMMIFLLAFARISSGLSNTKAMRSLFSAGFAGVFLCVTANLPRFIMLVTGNGSLLPDGYPFSLCDLSFALFAFAYIINAVRSAEKNDRAEISCEAKKAETSEPDGISEE